MDICMGESFQDYSWVEDFEADFHLESQHQNPESGFFGLFSVYLKTIDHLNLNFLY